MLRVSQHFSASDTGLQRRANEDAYFARSPVFVVADGMGGAQAGEVASRTAIDQFSGGLPDGPAPAEQRLADRVSEANARIHELSQADARKAGMGTTLTAAYIGPGEIAIAHVGDSRAYCLRGDELSRLTSDHSLVEELRRQGKLTEAEAEEHPQRSIITRALGPEPEVEVDTFARPAQAGDVYLLCSDGLTGMVSEQRLREILLRDRADLAAAGRAMIAEANGAGGRDNITVVLFGLEDVAEDSQVAAAPVAEPMAEGTVGRRLVPRLPGEPAGGAPPPQAARSRRRRLPGPARAGLSLLVLIAIIGVGGFLASQSIYFVGTDSAGRIGIYRGLPYELPAGVRLYRQDFVSGVTVAGVSARERARLLDHQLRSHDDASDLVRRLERGQIAQG
ncbi:MAG: Stp1/IreP family PP2C-type Ser/Thr phosphatase [Solirubrobacteraceae bacterium]